VILWGWVGLKFVVPKVKVLYSYSKFWGVGNILLFLASIGIPTIAVCLGFSHSLSYRIQACSNINCQRMIVET